MKYIKLFEEFIADKENKKDSSLDDLDLDLDLDVDDESSKKKKKKKDKDSDEEDEDPFKKEKDQIKKKKEKEEKKHDEYVENKKDKIEDILNDHPEINDELGKKIIDAVNSQDRVKIHNSFNDLIALQIKYQRDGKEDYVKNISKLKDQLDDLDKSYTDDKLM